MRKQIYTLLVPMAIGILLTSTLKAQIPEKMSYQAVIRDAANHLIVNQPVGMRISILHGSAKGSAVYVEMQTPTTNANGLITLEIGTGITADDFSAIDWANGPYFIKTETDPEGGTSYSITGISQILSVPFALHAKTAESVTGPVNETDPLYASSQAANLDEDDMVNLGNLSGTNTGDQDLSDLASKTALGDSTALVRSEIPDVSSFLSEESDPGFTSSQAANIDEDDIVNLGNLSGTNTGDQDLSALASKNALGDSTALVRSEIPDVSGFLSIESDPGFTSSQAANISEDDIINLGNLSGTNTGDQDLSTLATKTALADSTALVRNEIPDVSGFLSTESDPGFTSSQAANISEDDIMNLNNLSGTNTGDQDLSALATKTALGDSTALVRNEIPDVSSFLSEESDPIYIASQAANIEEDDIINLGNLSGTNTGDQDLSSFATKSALADSTTQVRSEIPDVSGFLSTELDPIFTASQAANIDASDITKLGNLEIGNNIFAGLGVNQSPSTPGSYDGNVIAIGTNARSYSVGANEGGIAIGPQTTARYPRPGNPAAGESIHTLTSIAIGGQADGDYGGIAIGHEADGQYFNLAIGANASCYSGYNRIAIGNDIINNFNGTIVLRGTLFLDNCPEKTIGGQTGRIFYRDVAPDRETHPTGSTAGWTAKAFTINHPLDPENKVLRHYCMEGPEVWNVYAGNSIVKDGKVEIQLPDYYEALNNVGSEIYSLTVVGGFADVCVLTPSNGQSFVIGATKDVQVSWTIKVLRNDEALLKDLSKRPVEQLKKDIPSELIHMENMVTNTIVQ